MSDSYYASIYISFRKPEITYLRHKVCDPVLSQDKDFFKINYFFKDIYFLFLKIQNYVKLLFERIYLSTLNFKYIFVGLKNNVI